MRRKKNGANGKRAAARDDSGARLRTGTPDVPADLPSHVRGVRMGNAVGNTEEDPGLAPREPDGLVGTGARSTGINPEDREPIDPSMPRLSPP